jgi:CubicO group peptidase (beta-lactamase class C family)
VSPSDLNLPVATPSEVGVDAAGVLAFLDAVDTAGDQELHSIALLRHGQVFARGWWDPYAPDDATLVYSLSKSFTSTALGFAVAEGRVALTDRVVDRLRPEGPVGPRTSVMTLRDLVAMATGHRADTLQDPRVSEADDPALGFLGIEPESDPGTVFAYNNPATYTLAAVLQDVTGQTLREYLRPRLFEPLGVVPGWWDQRPAGRDLGFTGLHLTTEVLVRFGQLYANGGTYAGRQVLPPGWAELALGLHTPNPAEPKPDWQQGYGFQFWRGRHGSVRGDGAFGQLVVLLPEQDAVLVTTAGTGNMQGVLDAAWAHLLPAFDAGTSDAADAALADRLDHLTLVTDRPDPLVERVDEQLRVTAVTAQDDGWALVLTEGGQALEIRVRRSGWARTDLAVADGWGVRVAARGTATGDDLAIDLVLLESPHRLRVLISPSGSTVTWHTAPRWRPTIGGLATPRP